MYNKLFSKIVRSSVWLEPSDTRLVWLTCLAIMDKDGFVDCAAVGNLAHVARVPVEATQTAVARLEGPDPDSSDRDFEGRRLERVEGGWIVLNSQKYRDIATAEVQREQVRIRVARSRAKKRDGNGHVLHVTARHASVTRSEADTEATTERTKTVRVPRPRPTEPADPDVKTFLTWFQAEYPKKRNGAPYLVRWDKDSAIIKRLLKATTLQKLQLFARILLSDQTDDAFIQESDRGIGVLAAKFNWLSDRLAAWEATHAQKVQA